MSTSTSRQSVSVQALAVPEHTPAGPAALAASDGIVRCPACGGIHPIAPERSRHRSPQTIEHDWRCDTCGHAWTTTTTVTAPPAAGAGRFAVGALVMFAAGHRLRATPPDAVFQILARRQSDSGDVRYRMKSEREAFERVVAGYEILPVPAGGAAPGRITP